MISGERRVTRWLPRVNSPKTLLGFFAARRARMVTYSGLEPGYRFIIIRLQWRYCDEKTGETGQQYETPVL